MALWPLIFRSNTTLYPPESALIGFGHIDLVLATNAEELVWAPVLEWIRKH